MFFLLTTLSESKSRVHERAIRVVCYGKSCFAGDLSSSKSVVLKIVVDFQGWGKCNPGGGNSNIFYVHSDPCGNDPIWLAHILQMGRWKTTSYSRLKPWKPIENSWGLKLGWTFWIFETKSSACKRSFSQKFLHWKIIASDSMGPFEPISIMECYVRVLNVLSWG